MYEVLQTDRFARWLMALQDKEARSRIVARIDRLRFGNPGDVKPVGGGVSELRVDIGPGYRVYFCRQGERVILLLSGGDKRRQAADIAQAIALARALREEEA